MKRITAKNYEGTFQKYDWYPELFLDIENVKPFKNVEASNDKLILTSDPYFNGSTRLLLLEKIATEFSQKSIKCESDFEIGLNNYFNNFCKK